jgi:protein-disulfide isomerase
MSRKSKRNQKPREAPAQQATAPRGIGRRGIFVAAVMALLLAFVAGTLYYKSESDRSAQQAAAKNRELLPSVNSPGLGSPDAKVHIVEFLDPACETCAVFYPHVKKLMAENPGRIRLSVRHVPFHKGSEHVVRMLEAARSQGKYWQALEAVFASQSQWTMNHQVYPERVWPSLAGIGLDLDRARSDMNSAEIAGRMERDVAVAKVLDVSKTPEFFVNGAAAGPGEGGIAVRLPMKKQLRNVNPPWRSS